MTVMGDSTNISTYTRPEKVKNLTIANVTISSVLLSWEPPEGCSSSYLIQIQGNSTISIKVDSIFFSIEDLTPGNYYTFLVSALIGENNFQGNIVAISTYTKPGAVQNLTALYISTSSVSLSWKPPEGNASSYLIQIQGNATFNMIVTLNFIAIRNLISGQNYTFLISALVGEPYLQGRISSLSIIILPEKIRNLIAYNITTSSVSLSWQPPEGYSNAYRIQIQENRTFLMEVTSCFITIEGLTPGNYYTFLVSSLTGETYIQGNSTAIAVNIEPGEVKDLTIYNITTTSMSLNWHPPDGNFSYFLIQILGNSTFNRNVTSYFTIVDGLIPGNYYTLLVTAIAGESDKKGQSANISNYARPSSVILKDVFKVGINSIYVSWLLSEGNRSSYLVEVKGDPSQRFSVMSESVVITNLTSRNQYTVSITAVAGEHGLLGISTDISVLLLQNISATYISNTSVLLSWEPVIDLNIYYNISVYGSPTSYLTLTNTTLFIDDLTPGNFYTIQISAYKEDKLIYHYVGEISLYTRPNAVTDTQYGNVSTNSVDLRWLQPTGNFSFYRIEVTGDSKWQNLTTNSESVTIDGLKPGNQYTFIIVPITGPDVQGDASEITVFTKPGKVQNLTTYSIGTTSVSLSWQPPEGNWWSYLIQILEMSAFSRKLAINYATIDSLIPGNYYTFIVTALVGDSGIKGEIVNTSTYTKPERVQNLTTCNISTNSVSLTWQPPKGNFWSYLIQILENSTFSKTTTLNNTTTDSLIPGNYYTFIITALVGDSDIKGESTKTSTYTKPGVVKSLTAYNITTSSVSLSWVRPEGNASCFLIEVLGHSNLSKNVVSNFTTIDGLTPGNFYVFIVSALVGESNVRGESANTSTYTIPGRIKNLTIVCVTEHTVSLSWQPPEGNPSFYVFRIEQFPTFNSILNVENVTTDNLTPGNFYTFYISAFFRDSFVEGYRTSISTYTVPGRIKNLTIVCATEHTVSVSWQPPEGNCSVYIFRIAQFPTFSGFLTVENVTSDNLTPGNFYTFYISAAVGDYFVEGYSTSISTYMKPERVLNLATYNISTTSVSLSWQPPEGNYSSYLIQILENATFNRMVTLNATTIDGLTPGNYYTFIVTVVVADDISGESANASTYTKPERVQNLTTYNISTTSVSLRWQPPVGNCWYYLIQMLENSNFSKRVTINDTTIDSLTPGNYYTFIITALVGGNDIKGESAKTSTYTMPGRIENLTIVCATEHTVFLSWQPPEGNRSVYIFRIAQFPTFSGFLTVENVTSDNLTPGNFYTFYISAAVGDYFVEGYSTSISTYMKPERVLNLATYNISTTSVSLSWQPPEGNYSSYLIQILENATFNRMVTLNATTIDGLTPGNYYTFIVTAVVADDISGESANASTYTKPERVQNLTTYNISTTSVSLRWQPPVGNCWYYLIQMLENSNFSKRVTINDTTIDSLTPGNYYTFIITALVGDSDIKGESAKTSTYTMPGRIENLTIVCATEHTVFLSWQPPEGNRSVYIFRIAQFPTFSSFLTVENVTSDNLTPGNFYTFYISAAVGDYFVEGYSTSISTYMKPERVLNLATYNISTTSVSLSWQAPEGNYSSYLIQILENATFNRMVTLNATTIDGLTPGNYYTFILTVVVADDISGESANASTYTKPERVQNLTTYNISTTSVSLRWQPPVGNCWYYLIQMLENSNFSTRVTINDTTIDSLTPGNYYTFIITALVGDSDIKGESAKTSTYTMPGRIENLTIVCATEHTVSLSWQPPEGNRSVYIFRIAQFPTFSG
uniref:Fibronectin type-III domain-containing protein n=1 Tax=Xenopus tropicalis TaxID=8364 RepID=A0A803JVT4_XENTR